MKRILTYVLTAALSLCSCLYASTGHEGGSPAVQMLEAQKDAKRLDGSKLKIAKPFIKRTPMGVIIDEIEMMIICPLEKSEESSRDLLPNEAKEMLKNYILVKEIDDEKSKMAIYIDNPTGEDFSEIVIYNARPDASLMLFSGNFTVESLIKVGEVSEQQRKHLKKYN